MEHFLVKDLLESFEVDSRSLEVLEQELDQELEWEQAEQVM